MKTLKIAMVAALVACTMITMAQAKGLKVKPKGLPLKVVTCTIAKAAHIPGLAQAMYEQIDKEELLNTPQAILTAKVTFNGVEYRIYGTRDQWEKFFKLKGELPKSNAPGFGIG